MSLVGPRPMMLTQEHLYPFGRLLPHASGDHRLWQTSVRNDASFAERAKFDADYDRDLSLPTDLKLLARTVRTVLRGDRLLIRRLRPGAGWRARRLEHERA